ncbi:MAG: hypothetical protein ACNS60_12280 [Candidatus Cyclobacteriaceae bacterium M2_1C_046]
MENSFGKEVLIAVKKNFRNYIEWLKPRSEDSLGLKIVKTFFKSFTTLLLIAFSPVILLILMISFLVAF